MWGDRLDWHSLRQAPSRKSKYHRVQKVPGDEDSSRQSHPPHLLLFHGLEVLLVSSVFADGQALADICRPLDLTGSDHHLQEEADVKEGRAGQGGFATPKGSLQANPHPGYLKSTHKHVLRRARKATLLMQCKGSLGGNTQSSSIGLEKAITGHSDGVQEPRSPAFPSTHQAASLA